MRQRITLLLMVYLMMFVVGCSKASTVNESNHDENIEQAIAEDITGEDIQLTAYAEEIGFILQTPNQDLLETQTVVDIQGNLEQVDDLNEEHIWVVITRKEAIEDIDHSDFNYYLPLENGNFSKEMFLHHGLGEYEVSIRAPSNKVGEEEIYYDVATFTVFNQDEDIKREVEYTQHGVHNQIELSSPIVGINQSDSSVLIEGKLSTNYQGEMILVQVKKDHETRQLIFPTKNSTFQGDVPLYFGEGYHSIQIQTLNEDDGLYYEAASFFVDNQLPTEFAEMDKYHEYISRGVMLDEPTWKQEAVLSRQEYRIAGEIDQTVPDSEGINYIIVTVTHVDEDLESSYLIPVENYQFDGLAYFRFGSGNYEVIISVPDLEKQDQSMFYYQGVVKVNHQVTDIDDQRALLPARGIESDNPVIIQRAKEITAGLSKERDQAKAIYKYVAEHVAYDVQKAENDIFNISDSALTTLQSGTGICQDYAFLTTALLRAIGMESNFIEGDAGERHAWVEAKVDGEWLVMDPTWGAGYVHEGVFHFKYNEDFFDPDPTFLAETHSRDGIIY